MEAMSDFDDFEDFEKLIEEVKAGGPIVGHPWADYYRPGMSDRESQAFKAGFAAALTVARAEIARLQAAAVEWGLVFEGRDDVDSWANDERGARHRASKFDDMIVMRRVYPDGEWEPA